MTFVQFEDRCLGVTNEHVLRPTFDPTSGSIGLALCLRHRTTIPGELILTSTRDNPDFPYDIAVFQMDPAVLQAEGKVPHLMAMEPRHLTEGEPGLAVGFPARERYPVADDAVIHGAYHVVATCRSFTDRQILLGDDLPNDPSVRHFAGMSGGPIYRFSGEELSLVGIIRGGRGLREPIADCPVTADIRILGFPLNASVLSRALELATRWRS